MKIKSYKKIKNNSYQISFYDFKEDLVLFDDLILKYDLLLKKEITEKEYGKLVKENRKLICYYKAISYITNKNRCKKEIKDYLKKNKFANGEIENTISLLEEKKLIDKKNYLHAFVNDQVNLTNNGPQKIKRKLLDLEFLEEEIEEVIQQVPNEVWHKKLEKFLEKKISTNHKDGIRKIHEKVLYACMNEGYNKADAIKILDTLDFPHNYDALRKEAERLYRKYSCKYVGQELFYQIKGRLMNKGFSYYEVDQIMENVKQLRGE